MKSKAISLALLCIAPGLLLASCGPPEQSDLDKLGTIDLTINGRKFRLWIADEADEQARGLMRVTAEQMADLPDGTPRGMIFVFPSERHLYFWMKDTIIPLDIAYVTTAGRVATTYTMAPLDTRLGQYRSGEPVRFAIEVNAGVWADLGLKPGDQVAIPQTLLNRTP